jgi:hypothetical protein
MMKGVSMEITENLLLHWWHHYGKHLYNFAELEEFRNIIQKYGEDRVFDAVIASFICFDGSPTTLLLAMRDNSVEEYFEKLPNPANLHGEDAVNYENFRQKLLKALYESTNT